VLVIQRFSRMIEIIRIRRAPRIVLGGGGVSVEGWVVTDKPRLNITEPLDFARYWRKGSRSAFLAEHVWEHLEPGDARLAAENCCSFLRSGGRLRIAVPDGYHPSPEYIDGVRPGGTGDGAWDHKILYNFDTMKDMLEMTGFEVILLEYWDELGTFHAEEMDHYFGVIRRSSRNDRRNQGGELVYTSLIVDGVKH